MTLHVDIIKNDPIRGRQDRIGKITDYQGRLAIDEALPGYLDTFVRHVSHANTTSHPLDTLIARMTGTYVFATDAHDDANCPCKASDHSLA